MQLHPVIDQTIRHDPLTATAAIVYVAVLVAAALVTMRRPIYSVCALVAVTPFAFYHDLFATTITLPKAVLVGVALGCFAHPRFFWPWRERPAARILLAGSLVLAGTALSIAHAQHKIPALRETLKAVEYLLLFATVYVAYRLEPDRRLVRAAVAGVVIAVCVLALSQEVLGAPSGLFLNGHPTPRIAGPLEGPNQLAGYLDVALPVLFAFAIVEATPLVLAALLAAVFADVLTFSRAGMMGGLAGLIVVALVYRRNLLQPLASMGAGLLLGGIVATFWDVAAHIHSWVFSSPFFRSTATSYGGGVGTRSELWHAAYVLWRAHPLFGVGAGNYELELPLAGLHGVRTHANSLYLQSLVEGGLPLLAATLYLTYTSIATFVRERAASPLVAGALGASVALALHQVVDFLVFYPKVGEWWWIVLALGAAELACV